MNAWSHLPNAKHIDWVIESLSTHPKLWSAAGNANGADVAKDSAYDAAWDGDRDEDRDAAWNAARYATRDAAWFATRRMARYTACYVARSAILALIAYDDCDQYLSMTADELRVWAQLSENPAALLLVPMVEVREQVQNLTNNHDSAILYT